MKLVKLSEVKINPNNPRLIKDDNFKKLVQSIKDFPEMLDIRPIVVNQDMIILGGNMRYKACKEAGLKEIPVIVTDLTEEQQREFLIKDNTSGGEWDWEVLKNEWNLEQLDDWGMDIPDFATDVVLEAEEDDFDTTPPEIPITVLGDLYEIGEHRLLCGDSTCSDTVAKLMNGDKADMVFTDPPYGISYKSNWDSKEREKFDKLQNDDVILEIVPSLILLSKNNIHWYVWTSHQVYPVWRKMFDEYYKSTIIWSKKSGAMGDLEGDYVVNYEMALFCHYGRKELNGKRESAVWEIIRDSGLDYKHPTQKPILLAEKAINNSSKKNDLIFDLFLGSGSTMVASHQLKRKCYGMELDPKYCDVIVKRMIKLDPTLTIKRNGLVTKDFE